MKVRLSITLKVMVILLIMMLTVTVAISTILIDQSENNIDSEQVLRQARYQRLLSIYEDVLHNRTVLWLDAYANAELAGTPGTEVLAGALASAREYLSLNMQIQDYWLYQSDLVTGSSPAPDFLPALVKRTQDSLQSRFVTHCTEQCIRYLTVPVMAADEPVPVVVLSLRMVELLSLLTQSTGAARLALVSTDPATGDLQLASRLTAENKAFIDYVLARVAPQENHEALNRRGIRMTMNDQHLLVSLLPLENVLQTQAYVLVVQNITDRVEQARRYETQVLGIAASLFAVFAVLLYLFLRQYGRKLMQLSRRLPLLADHKFREFEQAGRYELRPDKGRLRDELDVLEHVADDLAFQLEEIDGQMAINTAKLEKIAMFDSLTGLPNRNMLTFQIEQHADTASPSEKMIALMFMDLDDFKKVNDSYGHDVGDKLLKAAALRISRPLGESDIASRFGGDEFVVLITEAVSRDHVETIARHILQQFEAPIDVGGMQFYISVSIGIAISPRESVNAVELLRHADIAMYDVKGQKGAGYRVYDSAMNQQIMNKVEMEREARIALKENQFFLALQPQLDLKTRELVGFEALLRWRHPEKGLIPPGDFIPLLENTAFMLELDYWVVARATYLLNALITNGYPDVKMAINLSSGHFMDPTLPSFLQNQIDQYALPPGQISLELTETVLVSDLSRATTIMHAIRDMGCLIAIDDFGTGYSSLSYLKSLPADFIKIDQSFIAGMAESQDDRSIVLSTISMVRSLGLTVIAEGLESPEQYELLCHFDCHQGQGYLISRPINEDDLWAELENKVAAGVWTSPLPVFTQADR
ncbi:putative bifunctional diguanylate cyclase/phosphodiesterase [Alteromonas sp. CYL-A6]|uniref:putative bifunctional diguanylate cyclase/phosphodiesterase n=1 Tax=Alteromonas nitratireducens TaxID=3390813 RepID=UPI0034BCB523